MHWAGGRGQVGQGQGQGAGWARAGARGSISDIESRVSGGFRCSFRIRVISFATNTRQAYEVHLHLKVNIFSQKDAYKVNKISTIVEKKEKQ